MHFSIEQIIISSICVAVLSIIFFIGTFEHIEQANEHELAMIKAQSQSCLESVESAD